MRKAWTGAIVLFLVFVVGCASVPQPEGATHAICGKCGREIPLNLKECPFCGAVLSEPKEEPGGKTVNDPDTDVLYTITQQPPAPKTAPKRRTTSPKTPKVKVGCTVCLGERDAQRFFDVFASVELVRLLFYPEDPFSPCFTVDVGFSHELLFLGIGITHLVEGWEDFGAFLFFGLDWKRRYGIDEADGAIGFGLSFGGF